LFRMRYEFHLHTKKQSYIRNMPWKFIGMFPVRYELHLPINTKVIPVTGRGVPYRFSVWYEYHIYTKM
jgi:hypothetical protein